MSKLFCIRKAPHAIARGLFVYSNWELLRRGAGSHQLAGGDCPGVGGGRGIGPPAQTPGRLAAVDMLQHQDVEQLAGLAGGRGQPRDFGVSDRELSDLPQEVRLDEETTPPPEVLILAEDGGEAPEEGLTQVRRTLLERHALDAPGRVHQIEKRLDVVAHDGPAGGHEDLLQATGQIRQLVGPARPHVGMQGSDRLHQRECVDQVLTPHPLGPADLLAHDELLVVREGEEHLDHVDIQAHIAQDDVGADLHPLLVEDAEPLALPGLRGVQVDQGAETRLSTLEAKLLGRGDPLQSVDDERPILQEVEAVPEDRLAAAHPQLHVGHAIAGLHGFHQGRDLGERLNLPLVGVGLQLVQRYRVNDAPDHDGIAATRSTFVECSVDNFDTHDELLPVRGPIKIEALDNDASDNGLLVSVYSDLRHYQN